MDMNRPVFEEDGKWIDNKREREREREREETNINF